MPVLQPRFTPQALFLLVAAAVLPHVACIHAVAPTGSSQGEEAAPALRLPSDTHVLAEHLDLDIDPSRTAFRGVADIDLHLDRSRSTIWLHGRDLRVTRATVTAGPRAWEGTWVAHPDAMASVHLAGVIPAGDVSLHVEYEADFSSSDVGVSRVERDGRHYAFTQFALIEARRAFPCFDEPSFKSPFTLALTIPDDDTQAIANMPEDTRLPLPRGRALVRFRTTPPIPAYLVAFAVGPFDIVRAPDLPASKIRPRPLPLRGVATKGRGGRLAYTLRRAAAAVPALEDYFASPFPFEKLDIIAVPNKSGAMENPGAVTFSEDTALLDEATASEEDKQYLLRHVAHELAHQWLGDFVTMSWWDDTWLNEAFATWMAAKVADRVDPLQHVDLVNLRAVDRTMTMDARDAARSVRQPIASSDDIASSLDSITYNKGSAVLGMFERWMGADTFRTGVRSYVESHAFGSAKAEDLFAALSAVARRDISAPFRSFIEQPGVPFVDVQVRCSPQPLAHVAQSRFAPLGSTIEQGARWSIPLCMRYGAAGKSFETCVLLDATKDDVALEACPDWIVPNADAAGYYRFSLEHDALEKTRQHLDALTTREVLSLASNLRADLLRGSTSVADVLRATAVLGQDSRPEVLRQAFATLSLADGWLFGDSASGAFQAFADRMARPAFDELGWEPRDGAGSESSSQRERRGVVVAFLAHVARDANVRREAKERARRLLGLGGDGQLHRDALLPDLTEMALIVAAEDGDARVFEAMLGHLRRTEDVSLRSMLADALAAFQSPELAQRARELALSEVLQPSESEWVLVAQLNEPRLRDDAWRWLLANGDALLARTQDATTRQFVVGNAGYLCDAARTSEIDSFLAHVAPKVDGGPRAAANARERARLCATQRATLLPSLRAYFDEQEAGSSARKHALSP